MARSKPRRFRRSPHLALFWQRGRLRCHNYLSKAVLSITPDVLSVLDALDEPRTIEEIARQLGEVDLPVKEFVQALVMAGLVEPTPPSGREATIGSLDGPWQTWGPFATAYHFATRDGIFPGDVAWVDPYDGTHSHAPAQHFRRYRGTARVPLPAERHLGALTTCLDDRRTWRKFGARALPLESLATLLRLTFGVRRWHDQAPGRIAFRTSPSGGARHPIEAYVCVQNVAGLDRGLYHYNSVDHELTPRKHDLSADDVARYLVRQAHFLPAHAVVFLTAVFGRTAWRYRSPRAYRAVLIEAGHLAQTFCLVGTALSLAPFTTMAFAETEIERDLDIKGAEESVMYVAGVGPRP
jgi:SagB-type dehydrogenase family enzyme